MIPPGTLKAEKQTPPDSDEEQPDQDEQPDGKPVPPEAVCYHTSDENCANCVYMENGSCTWLKMPVGEGDWCKLYEAKGGSEPDTDERDGPPDSDEDDGPPAMQ
jgi:hypothetical protein